jgi:hypothetical protein
MLVSKCRGNRPVTSYMGRMSKTTTDTPPAAPVAPAAATPAKPAPMPKEIGGPKGPEPTRFGDWEQKGRATDF